jgi:hypothetical protein
MSYGRDSPTVCGTGAKSTGTPAREHAMKWSLAAVVATLEM